MPCAHCFVLSAGAVVRRLTEFTKPVHIPGDLTGKILVDIGGDGLALLLLVKRALRLEHRCLGHPHKLQRGDAHQ